MMSWTCITGVHFGLLSTSRLNVTSFFCRPSLIVVDVAEIIGTLKKGYRRHKQQ